MQDSGNTINLSARQTATLTGTLPGNVGGTINWTITAAGKILSTGSGSPGSSVSASWDGTDALGKQVASGSYDAKLYAGSSGGSCNDSNFKSTSITVTAKKPANPKSCTASQASLEITADSEINIASGNLYHSQPLFTLPNSKFLGEFNLSYNSLSSQNDVLGMGWTHAYNIGLAVNNDGSYTVVEGDGGNLALYGSSGHYTPQNSSYPSLTINGDGTFTLEYKEGIFYSFDQTKKITSIYDRNSNSVTFAYTGNNLTSITDPSGRIVSFTYNANNTISTIADPSGNTHTLTYTGQNLTRVSSQISGVGTANWSYTYDTNGFMLTKTDPLGNLTSYAYDGNHRVSQVTDPLNRNRTFSYNPGSSQTQLTEKDGGVWTYTYNPTIGALTAKTDPLVNTTSYAFDTNGNLTLVTDPRTKTTTYAYDSNANVTSITDALNNITTYTYNSLNKVTSIVYPGNATVTLTYDTHGNLTSLTDPVSNLTQYGYDTRGNLTGITDPLTHTTTLAYDSHNYLTTVTDPTNAVTSFTYDSAGNMLTITDPLSNVPSFQYNGLNKVKKITDPLGNFVTLAYDLNGNVISRIDANNKVSQYAYNYKSQVTTITDALNNLTQFAYGSGCPSCGSSADRLTSVTDARGKMTSFQYDLAGRLIKETDPLGRFKSYAYDPAGNRTSRTDEDNMTVQYAYDNLNRLTQISYPNSTTTTFGYDARNNLTSAANPNIGYTLTYDLDNRLTQIVDSDNKTVSYQYNGLNQRTQMVTPDGRTITYGYNTTNRLSQISSAIGAFNISYDDAGRRTSLDYPNLVTTTYSYNASSFLTNLLARYNQQTTINSFAYTPDGMSNRTSMIDLAGTHNYTYDNTYQLTQATHPNMATEQFTYDAVGNRSSSEGQAPSTGRSTDYVYDFENRLIEVDYSGMTAQYKYDPFGRRIEKNVNNTITRYIYDGSNIVTQYDGSWNVTAKYTHTLDIDDPLTVQQGVSTFYYLKDGLGSVVNLTDASGNVLKGYTYKSFGEIYSETGSLVQPFTFTGREYDPESGLYFYRARYYDPRAGRFLTKDPIGFASGDTNLYRYLGNDPLNLIDPFGLEMASLRAGKAVVEKAKGWLGVPYEEGGSSRKGIDCSHFVCIVYEEAGLSYPYTPSGNFGSSQCFERVKKGPQEGDIILFRGHMGIYTEGKVISAQSGEGKVTLGEIKWFGPVKGYYRYIK